METPGSPPRLLHAGVPAGSPPMRRQPSPRQLSPTEQQELDEFEMFERICDQPGPPPMMLHAPTGSPHRRVPSPRQPSPRPGPALSPEEQQELDEFEMLERICEQPGSPPRMLYSGVREPSPRAVPPSVQRQPSPVAHDEPCPCSTEESPRAPTRMGTPTRAPSPPLRTSPRREAPMSPLGFGEPHGFPEDEPDLLLEEAMPAFEFVDLDMPPPPVAPGSPRTPARTPSPGAHRTPFSVPSPGSPRTPPRRFTPGPRAATPISPATRAVEDYLSGWPLDIQDVPVEGRSPAEMHHEQFLSPPRPPPVAIPPGVDLFEEQFEYQSPCSPCGSPEAFSRVSPPRSPARMPPPRTPSPAQTPPSRMSPRWEVLASARVPSISPERFELPESPPPVSPGRYSPPAMW